MSQSKSMNRVILVGNVVHDAEIRMIPATERELCKFAIVTNEVFKDKLTNEWRETAEFHDCTAWGNLAKKAERVCKKGNTVSVEGKIKTRKWEDKEGNKRKSTEITVDELVLITDRQKVRESRGPGDVVPDEFPGYDKSYDYSDNDGEPF